MLDHCNQCIEAVMLTILDHGKPTIKGNVVSSLLASVVLIDLYDSILTEL